MWGSNMHDIVYFVKKDLVNEELRYSLRSVEANFPHSKLVFYGGCPNGMLPDLYHGVVQHGATKWERVTAMIRMACNDDAISDDFWLFNDDFFVMKRTKEPDPQYNGDLYRHIVQIENRHSMTTSAYSKKLRETVIQLERKGYGTLNYAVHVPILINKQKAIDTLNEFSGYPMFRSLYGNMHKIGGRNEEDVKVNKPFDSFDKNSKFLSTNDVTFSTGLVGSYIREKFKDPCKWEV